MAWQLHKNGPWLPHLTGFHFRYYFGTANGDTEKWINALKLACKAVRDKDKRENYGKWVISRTHKFYHSPKFQSLLAVVIVSNFVISCIKAQLVPDDTGSLAEDFETLDYFYTSFFLVRDAPTECRSICCER